MREVDGGLCRWCGYPRRWRIFDTEGGALGFVAVDDLGRVAEYPPVCVVSPTNRCEPPRSLLERQQRRRA